MSFFSIKGPLRVKGTLYLPGDKSIAHRCIILSSLSSGTTKIHNFPLNSDCLSTLAVFRQLGVRLRRDGDTVTVRGKGLYSLRGSKRPIFIRESGTTFRLMLGVLAGQPFDSTLTAGAGLSARPMLRVTRPLRRMGASLRGRRRGLEEYPPIAIKGAGLKAISYRLPVASAQVKSALLLAGLYAAGATTVVERHKSRDHTERMLEEFSAPIRISGKKIRIRGGADCLVSPGTLRIPGDTSSAAFFVVLSLITRGSAIRIRNVGLNGTRTGMISVLRRMGGRVRTVVRRKGPEPAGDIYAESSALKGTVVGKEEIPFLIDELPALMVAAACAEGKSVFRGVGELRVKETDRIFSMATNLRKMGVRCEVAQKRGEQEIIVPGAPCLRAAGVGAFGDHRTAMSMVIAGAAAGGRTTIDGIECIDKSFPGFIRTLKTILREQ